MQSKHLFIATAIANTFLTPVFAQNNPHFEIISAAAMPLKAPPGEEGKVSLNIMTTAVNGSMHAKDPKKHADFRRSLEIALSSAIERPDTEQRSKRPPSAVKDITKLQIAFTPKKLATDQQLLVASPAGMLTSNGWSGLERFVSISRVGQYKLTEFDLTKTGGKFFLSSDAVNANVDNVPAGAKSFLDDDGDIVEEVVWVSDGRFHMLTFLPETMVTALKGQKEKRAPSTSAISIAQALRK